MKMKRLLYIIIGAIVVVLVAIGIGIFVILPNIASADTSQKATPTPTTATTTTKTAGNGINKILKQYAPDIKNQIAQGLHLTSDQLTAQLQSGKTLTDIATAQNVSSTQLQTIVGNALQTALQPAVDAGTLTQQQLTRLIKKAQTNPQMLDRLLGGKASKLGTPTPTPTP
jgi:flagellar basal body-associated protein FliL